MADTLRDDARGAAVQKVLDDRGLNPRSQRRLTDVNHVTAGQMAAGYGATMETVVKFARGLGLNVDEWLVRYGYAPLGDPDDGPAHFLAGIEALVAEHGEFTFQARHGLDAIRTVADAERELANLRLMLESGGGGGGNERGAKKRGGAANAPRGGGERGGPARTARQSPARERRGYLSPGLRLVVSPA